jgi:hypothetical protein
MDHSDLRKATETAVPFAINHSQAALKRARVSETPEYIRTAHFADCCTMATSNLPPAPVWCRAAAFLARLLATGTISISNSR